MRVAICDDVLLHREKCAVLLRKISRRRNIGIEVLEYDRGEQLLFALEDNKGLIDLVYLDISMPGEDGMTIAKKIREKEYGCEIIFFTGHEKLWKEAFFVKALHYIIKEDYTEEEFERIFMLAVDAIKKNEEERVVFTCAGEYRNIRIADIDYFEVRDHIVTVHFDGDATFDFYTPLSRVEKQLMNKAFIRCHKSYLISKRRVRNIHGNEIIMNNGDVIPISRTYRAKVKQSFSEEKE